MFQQIKFFVGLEKMKMTSDYGDFTEVKMSFELTWAVFLQLYVH